MAQIKMDVSEYEAMQKNEKLLEEALKREKELSAEVSKLQKEKIEALKKNEKRVVKITRHISRDFVRQRLPDHEIAVRLEREFRSLIDHKRRGYTSTDWFSSRLIESSRDLNSIVHFADMFFDVHKAHDVVDQEEITTHGLDEITKELREQITIEVTGKLEKELEDAKVALGMKKELLEQIDEYKEKLDDVKADLQKTREMLDARDKEYEKCSRKIYDLYDLSEAWEELKFVVNVSEWPRFFCKEIQKGLKDLIERTDKKREEYLIILEHEKKQQK